MPSCAVEGCGISEYFIKKTGSSMCLHVFPKDPVQSKQWEAFCGPPLKPGRRFICSDHFENEDFENFYASNMRRILRKSAVPSIRARAMEPSSERYVYAQRKARKKIIAELMETREKSSTDDSGTISQCSVRSDEDCSYPDVGVTLGAVNTLPVWNEKDEAVEEVAEENPSSVGHQYLCEQSEEDSDVTSISRGKKRKIDAPSTDQLLQKVIHALNKEEDQYDVFGKYIASEIRSVSSDMLRRKMKRKLLQVILEINEEDEQHASAAPQSCLINPVAVSYGNCGSHLQPAEPFESVTFDEIEMKTENIFVSSSCSDQSMNLTPAGTLGSETFETVEIKTESIF